MKKIKVIKRDEIQGLDHVRIEEVVNLGPGQGPDNVRGLDRGLDQDRGRGVEDVGLILIRVAVVVVVVHHLLDRGQGKFCSSLLKKQQH